MVNTGLQPCDLCKIDIIACLGFRLVESLPDPPTAVLVDRLTSLCSLKLLLHRGFNPRRSHNIVDVIVRTALFQFFQLVLLYLAGIADDRRKIYTVIVYTDRGFLAFHTL